MTEIKVKWDKDSMIHPNYVSQVLERFSADAFEASYRDESVRYRQLHHLFPNLDCKQLENIVRGKLEFEWLSTDKNYLLMFKEVQE